MSLAAEQSFKMLSAIINIRPLKIIHVTNGKLEYVELKSFIRLN